MPLSFPNIASPSQRSYELDIDADKNSQLVWEANLSALSTRQPRVCKMVGVRPAAHWRYARDGSLTAIVGGNWWGGNSLPRRAAEQMLKDVDAGTAVSCIVAPVHGAAIKVLLERIAPQQAVIAIMPDRQSAALALACQDFSDEILAGRLWWIVGEDWSAQLDRLLTELPGLPVAGRFIRTPDVEDAVVQPILTQAQSVFGQHIQMRSERIGQLRQSACPADRRQLASGKVRVCVVAPSRFRLWDNAARVLGQSVRESESLSSMADWTWIDPDQPIESAPLAVALAAADCDAIVMADRGRSDNMNLVRDDLVWITWTTSPRLPKFVPSSPHDRLLIADAGWGEAARALGWPDENVAVANWPVRRANLQVNDPPRHLVLLADVVKPATPPFGDDFSSHRLVWEAIDRELSQNPFSLGTDIHSYLDSHLRRAGIDATTVDRSAFIENLILPGWAISLAALLVRGGIPLEIHGDGWDETQLADRIKVPKVPVRTSEALDAIIDRAAGLVRPWPVRFCHEIDAQGRPVVTAGRSEREFLIQCRSVVAGQAVAAARGAEQPLHVAFKRIMEAMNQPQ
jgi:hypothetical protein